MVRKGDDYEESRRPPPTPPDSSTWKTTVTPPVLPYDSTSNIATYVFNNLGQETSRNFYQGAESPANLLRTINTTWATNKTPASQTTILENNQQFQTQTDFDSNGLLLESREYDLGTGGPGSLMRRTTYTYATIGHIINKPASIIVPRTSGEPVLALLRIVKKLPSDFQPCGERDHDTAEPFRRLVACSKTPSRSKRPPHPSNSIAPESTCCSKREEQRRMACLLPHLPSRNRKGS